MRENEDEWGYLNTSLTLRVDVNSSEMGGDARRPVILSFYLKWLGDCVLDGCYANDYFFPVAEFKKS